MLFMNVTQVIADIILTIVLCVIVGDHKTGFKRFVLVSWWTDERC